MLRQFANKENAVIEPAPLSDRKGAAFGLGAVKHSRTLAASPGTPSFKNVLKRGRPGDVGTQVRAADRLKGNLENTPSKPASAAKGPGKGAGTEKGKSAVEKSTRKVAAGLFLAPNLQQQKNAQRTPAPASMGPPARTPAFGGKVNAFEEPNPVRRLFAPPTHGSWHGGLSSQIPTPLRAAPAPSKMPAPPPMPGPAPPSSRFSRGSGRRSEGDLTNQLPQPLSTSPMLRSLEELSSATKPDLIPPYAEEEIEYCPTSNPNYKDATDLSYFFEDFDYPSPIQYDFGAAFVGSLHNSDDDSTSGSDSDHDGSSRTRRAPRFDPAALTTLVSAATILGLDEGAGRADADLLPDIGDDGEDILGDINQGLLMFEDDD